MQTVSYREEWVYLDQFTPVLSDGWNQKRGVGRGDELERGTFNGANEINVCNREACADLQPPDQRYF